MGGMGGMSIGALPPAFPVLIRAPPSQAQGAGADEHGQG